MRNVAILSDLHDWHSNQIAYHLKKKKINPIEITFEELIFSLQKKKVFFHNNKYFNNLEGVWVRFFNSGNLEEITTKLTILHLLEKSKIYIHNTASIIEKTVDKVRTTGILKLNNIESPKTIVCFAKNKNKIKLKKKKYLIKPIFGSQGKNIFLFKNINELKKKNTGDVFYIQEFIESDSNEFCDLRVLVSNHRVVSTLERYSNHYLTNVYQGAKYRKIPFDKKIINLSVKISKIFDLGYGGIDLKIFKKKIYALEINSIPSWKAMQRIERMDISELLVKDFLEKLKK